MITYVNTVLVGNLAAATVVSAVPAAADAASNKGKFAIMDVDSGNLISSNFGNYNRIKVGIITGKTVKDHKGIAHTDIKWSNIIVKSDIKAIATLSAPTNTNTEDTMYIDLDGIDGNILTKFAEGDKRIITRLTFKDLPNRYRKWTESYEYVTKLMDVSDATAIAAAKDTIATDIVNLINKQWKRARVVATAGIINTTSASGTAIDGTSKYWHELGDSDKATAFKLVAMPYDDDDSVDTLNWANKVRFNANIYYTDPAGDGWESLNKHFPTGVALTKVPGFRYAADAKLVRDREAQAMGYDGILNRGEGTWPIIKPAMETNLSNKYDAITLEFENMYRAADDIFRKSKQTLEIYVNHSADARSNDVFSALTAFAAGAPIKDTQTEDGIADA